jgi:hypothetical protein
MAGHPRPLISQRVVHHAQPFEAFTLTPHTPAERLAVVLVFAGPLGPFNTPEDFDRLRERI